MRRLKKSLIAWSLGGSLSAFAALHFLLPYDRFLDLALAVAFGVCFAATVRYGRDAIRSFKEGRSGAEFLIVSIFAIVSVLLGQRVWGITLRVLDRPDWLVNSSITILIPWLLSWAVSLALIAPDVDLEPEQAKEGIWKSAALFIGGALAGFVVASSFGVKTSEGAPERVMWPMIDNRPSCPAESVWVSSKGVYHDASSRYKGMVTPKWCFKTVEEAKKAGFRAPM